MNIFKALAKGILALLLFNSVSLFAQDTTLFTIGGEPVTLKEFRYIYEKNNANDKGLYTEKNVKEYLDLYENFKLKVKEARSMGLDTGKKFLSEFNNYRNQLAQPYLTDREVTKSLVDEAFQRSKYELRASHILIPVSADAAPKDTLAAYNKAMEVRNKAMKGEDFEKLAREYSKDPSVANNGGDLGYFTVFQMIYPFETGAYNLKDTGEISMPIRTIYGYHIIRLSDRRPYRGEVHVRHILINSSDTDPKDKQAIAKNKIDSLYSLLQKGAKFSELAKQFSEHQQSKNNGGEIAAFNSFSQYPEEFKDAAFSLQKDGDITKPFKTQYGWHLLQRIDMKPAPSQKETEEMLKQRIAKDMRSEKSQAAAIEKFKKQYNFTEDKKALKKFTKSVDTTLLKGTWKPKEGADFSKRLFSIDKKDYTLQDFVNYLKEQERADKYRFTDVKYAVSQFYKQFVDKSVYDYHDKNLENLYPEFRNIVKEYREGILLFDITDKNVWGKAMQDTVGQKKFYNDHKDKYKWGERVNALVYDLRDKAAVADVKKQLEAGKKPEDISVAYVKKDPLSLNFKEGTYEKGENPVIDKTTWKPGIYDMGLNDGRYYLVKVIKVLPPDYKKFDEIKGNVIADYQDYLEKEWISSLKQKYPVVVNDQAVSSLIKKH